MKSRYLIFLLVFCVISCTSKEVPIENREPDTLIHWLADDIVKVMGATVQSIHNEVGNEGTHFAAILNFDDKYSDFENFTNSFNRWANKYKDLNFEYRWSYGAHPAALMKLNGEPEFYISFLFPEGWQGRFVVILQSAEEMPESTGYPPSDESG